MATNRWTWSDDYQHYYTVSHDSYSKFLGISQPSCCAGSGLTIPDRPVYTWAKQLQAQPQTDATSSGASQSATTQGRPESGIDTQHVIAGPHQAAMPKPGTSMSIR